jgi:hypothetical protein
MVGPMRIALTPEEMSRRKRLALRTLGAAVVLLVGALVWAWYDNYHDHAVREEKAKQDQALRALDQRAIRYARSLVVEDQNKGHTVTPKFLPNEPIQGKRPLILKRPYPTESEIESELGKPSSVDKDGVRVWLTNELFANRDPVTGRVSEDKTTRDKLIQATFDDRDGKLQKLEIYEPGLDTEIGRTYEDYQETTYTQIHF